MLLGTALVFITALVLQASPASAAPRAPRAYGATIEPLAAYSPQRICSPSAKAGTAAFAHLLLVSYPGTRSLGIVRACSVGGTSEHKEGRAFDWGGLSAAKATDRAKVNNLMAWLFATDKYGHKYAMARRLGVMYVIWNHHIWSSARSSEGWRPYSGSNPHTDHVHFSLTWSGAKKVTSFWTGKVGATAAAPSRPSPVAPTPAPDAPGRPAPIPAPDPAPTLLDGPSLQDEVDTVSAASRAGTTTRGELVAGQTYLVEVSGAYRWTNRSDTWADAECSTAPRSTWSRYRSVDRRQPRTDHLNLYLDGVNLNGVADRPNSASCDLASHTYRTTVRATRTGRAPLQIWDPTSYADNHGSLRVRVLHVVAKDSMTYRVGSWSVAGATTPGALAAGADYDVTVSGTYLAGHGVVADAVCASSSRYPQWEAYGSYGDRSEASSRILVDKSTVSARPSADTGNGCDAGTHTYGFTVKVGSTRPVNLRVADRNYANNSGSLLVTLRRHTSQTESLSLDSRGGAVSTTHSFAAGRPVLVRVTGTYTLRPGVHADAECTSTDGDPTWRRSRSWLVDGSGRPLGDVTIDGQLGDWDAVVRDGNGCASSGHGYTIRVTPDRTGPLVLGLADDDESDNSGTLAVSVTEA